MTTTARLFAAINRDPAVMATLGPPLSRHESDAFVDRIDARHDSARLGVLWAVEVVGGPDFVGYVGLAPARFEAHFTPAVEVGWRLACEHWGNGYATEAALAAVRDGYERAGLAEIVSWTAVVNTRSRAVMERIGLREVPGADFDHPRALRCAAPPPALPLPRRPPRLAVAQHHEVSWRSSRRASSLQNVPQARS